MSTPFTPPSSPPPPAAGAALSGSLLEGDASCINITAGAGVDHHLLEDDGCGIGVALSVLPYRRNGAECCIVTVGHGCLGVRRSLGCGR